MSVETAGTLFLFTLIAEPFHYCNGHTIGETSIANVGPVGAKIG